MSDKITPGLAGQVALITGASRGIGAATARHLARSGARLVLTARREAALDSLVGEIREAGGEAIAVAGDVRHAKALSDAVAAASRQFGRLDALVNNAGVIEPIGRLADTDADQWRKAVEINLLGVYHGLHAALPVMQAQGRGTIVNLSSGAATKTLEGWSAYCATKAAVLSLTRNAHAEYGEHGITVVGLSPGTVATDMQTTIRDSGINPVSRLPADAHIPADWPARAIGFLCTPAGREFAGEDFSIKTDRGRRLVGLD